MGKDVENSLSPLMQNKMLSKYSLNFCYLPFKIREVDLERAIQGIRTLNIKGVNITFPYKERVIKFLDQVEETARRVGAVNTIVHNKGILTGYNTDLIGFKKSLQKNGKFTIKGEKAVILGAGGAARAVVYSLLEEGIKEVYIFNRTIEKAEKIKQDFYPFFPQSDIKMFNLKKEELKDKIQQSHLLVNTTPLGMPPQMDITPLPEEGLFHPGLLVYDLIYHLSKTLFLKQAERAGAKTINGLPMLIYQGIESFYLWTGIKLEEKEELEMIERITKDCQETEKKGEKR